MSIAFAAYATPSAAYAPIPIDPEGASRLKVVGALDALTARSVRPVIDDVVARRPRRVVVDLEDLTLLDSFGVGLIVSLFKRLKAYGAELVVVGAHDQPLTVLRVLKLEAAFGM